MPKNLHGRLLRRYKVSARQPLMSTYLHVLNIPSERSLPCTNCSTMLVDFVYLSVRMLENVSFLHFVIGLFNRLTSFFLTEKKTNIWLMFGSSVPVAKKKKKECIYHKTKQKITFYRGKLAVGLSVLNKTPLLLLFFFVFNL